MRRFIRRHPLASIGLFAIFSDLVGVGIIFGGDLRGRLRHI